MRLLIVDDEKIICDGLKKLVEHIGIPEIETVRTTYDSREALKISAEFHPDILITDIRMPGLSGLELLKRVRSAFPSLRSIVLSGYDDYEFIREAFRQNAIDYLLKPATRPELEKVLTGLVEQILSDEADRAAQQREEEDLAASLFSAAFPWISGKVHPSREVIAHLADVLEERIGASFFCQVYLQFRETLDSADPDRFVDAHYNAEECGRLIHEVAHREYLVLFHGRSKADLQRVIANGNRSLRPADGIHATVGPVMKGFLYADRIYACLQFYRMMKLFQSEPFYALTEEECRDHPESAALYPDISRALKAGEPETAALRIHEILEAYRNDENRAAAIRHVSSVWNNILNSLAEISDSPENFDIAKMRDPASFFSLEAIEDYLIDLCTRSAKHETEHDNMIIRRARQYILNHLGEELDMHTAAEKAGVSYNYFSTLFKHSEGMNYSEYVTARRMEEAIRLLEHSTLKVGEIAGRLGYAYAKHFSRAFRRYFGVSPKQYMSGTADKP